jgi:hypothetical protein
MIIVNGAGDHEFMICPDTFSAKNTFTEIPDYKRIHLFIRRVIGHGIEAGITDTQISGYFSQLAPISLAADNA